MLTKEQTMLLFEIDRAEIFTEEDERILPGLHFCPDWDGLPVCDNSPEYCNCNTWEPASSWTSF